MLLTINTSSFNMDSQSNTSGQENEKTPIKHQSSSWTVATTIESGSQSLNKRRLHRDGVCGRGFYNARIDVFGADEPFSFTPSNPDGNSDDPGRLPFPIHL